MILSLGATVARLAFGRDVLVLRRLNDLTGFQF